MENQAERHSPTLAVAIPVYDHGKTLRTIAEAALAVCGRVLVVDDGGTDGGADSLAGLPVTLLRHPRNEGKGAAILTAAAEARRQGCTHLAVLDADGQFDPRDLARLEEAARREPQALVVGHRDLGAAGAPLPTRLERAFSNFWFRVQTGEACGDSVSGLRIYPLALLEGLRPRGRRFSFETEVLVKASWAGVPLREVAVPVRYFPRGQGRSHYAPVADTLRLSLLNTLLTVRSMLPWPHRRLAGAPAAPPVSLLHPWRSLRNLTVQNASPWELAGGAALGAFLGILPLVGFHTVGILFAAGYLRLNRWTALAAAQVGAPPFLPALCIEAGYYLRHGEFLTEVSLKTLGYQCVQRLYEWFLGGLVVAPVAAAALGCAVGLMALAVRRTLRGPAGGR